MFFSVDFSYLSSIVFTLIILFFAKKSDLKLAKGVFTFYFFLLTWIPINITVIFKRTTTWDEIKHTKSVTISELSGVSSPETEPTKETL